MQTTLSDLYEICRSNGENLSDHSLEQALGFLLNYGSWSSVGRASISASLIDDLLSEIDRRISRQVESILQSERFQALESAWRALSFLVERTDFRENIQIDVVNLSDEDLLDDFDDFIDITRSGFYKMAYSREYGQYGGQPYAALICNYRLGPSGRDLRLIQKLASVAAMAHAPAIIGASSTFFGVEDYKDFPELRDLHAILQEPKYLAWDRFRETEDARYVGLVLPRFFLRAPYGEQSNQVSRFQYYAGEGPDRSKTLWGNAVFALATRLADSFAEHRWCAHIVGAEGGGVVKGLSKQSVQKIAGVQRQMPVEVLISEKREYELSQLGFIGLTLRKNTNDAAFFSAPSPQKTKLFGASEEGRLAEFNFRLGTYLPYMFIICRLSHYIKMIQREHVGEWKTRVDLETELNQWLGEYVSDMNNPSEDVRSRRPLRHASINVQDVGDNASWFRVSLNVTPHLKYMGASFKLSLTGRLETT